MPTGYRPPQRQSSGAGKALIIAIVVVVGICGLGGVALVAFGDGKGDRKDADAPSVPVVTAPPGAGQPTDDSPAPAAGINATVRDGKFEFVVTAVESGVKTVGDNEFLQKTAQGSYTIVSMTVKNIGDRPQSFSPGNQYLFDQQGRKFESDTVAAMNLEADTSIYAEVNPGNSITAQVVFDMSPGAVPDHIVLHDSMFSGGARVDLE